MEVTNLLFLLAFAGMMFGLVLFFRLGLHVSKNWVRRFNWKQEGFGAIEASTAGLYALLLGFTFSSALNRHEERRKIVVQEANNLQTVILLSDLYDDTNRVYFRRNLHEYLETQIHYFEAGAQNEKLTTAIDSTNVIFLRIWKRASDLSRSPLYLVPTNQMLPALRELINIAITRDSAIHARLGWATIAVLFLMLLFSSFIMGLTSNYSTFHLLRFGGFVFASMSALILIIDLNRPFIGQITLKKAENRIVQLRSMFDH